MKIAFPTPTPTKSKEGGYILGVLSKGQAVWEFWFLIAYLKKFQTCMAYYFDIDLLLLGVWNSFHWLKMLWVHTSPWKLTCFWKWRRKRIPKKLRKKESGSWRHLSFSISPLSVSTTLSTQSQSNFFEVTSFCHKFEQKKTQLDLIIISLKGNFLSVLSIYLPPYEDKVKNTRSVF